MPLWIFKKNKLVDFDSPAMRLKVTRQIFDHLPAWRCQVFNLDGSARSVFFLCGRCFGTRGNGPATSRSEMWKPGTDSEGVLHFEVVPKGAWCAQCGGRAWPKFPD